MHIDNNKNIVSKDEKSWLIGLTIIVIIFTSIPYFIGYVKAGPQWHFSGFFIGIEDGNSYIAKMLAGESGDWLFRTPYTTFPQKGVFIYFYYILIGKMAVPPVFHDQLVALFQLFRIFSIYLYIIAGYQFLAFFIKDVRIRKFGVILLAFGGGMGWLIFFLGQTSWLNSLPLDLYSPESFGFLSLLSIPHLVISRALLLWGLLSYLSFEGTPKITGMRIGLLWLVMGIFQPLTVTVGWYLIGIHLVLTGLYQFWKNRGSIDANCSIWKDHLHASLLAILISSPLVLYTIVSMLTDPFFKIWSSQNLILSPNPLHYLLAYGLILPFAILGLRLLIKQNQVTGIFFMGWLISLPVLAYAPFNMQRRLPEGIWTAWVLLAMIWLASHSNLKVSRWSYAFFLTFPSTLLIMVGSLTVVSQRTPPVFLPLDEVKTFEYIRENIPVKSVFLCSFATGNQLPAWAPVRVVIGHGPESANLQILQPQVENFYKQQESDSARIDLIRSNGVRYIYWGPSEKAIGEWDPSQALYLRLIDREGVYSVYEVIQ